MNRITIAFLNYLLGLSISGGKTIILGTDKSGTQYSIVKGHIKAFNRTSGIKYKEPDSHYLSQLVEYIPNLNAKALEWAKSITQASMSTLNTDNV